MKSINLVVLLALITLSACGGGGSSSGGQPTDLTSCVAESVVEIESSLDVTRREYTYTNNCGVPVNLTTVSLTESTLRTISLAVDGTFTDTTILSFNFIACRPPSVGIDVDSDRILVQLGCS